MIFLFFLVVHTALNFCTNLSAHEHFSSVQPQLKEVTSHHEIMNRGMYGAYPMTREASGTSWLPESSPMEAIHLVRQDWSMMFHGYFYTIFDQQRGNLGAIKTFAESMGMFTVQKNLPRDTFAFRSMFSTEPFTIGKCGYPLLFQTGETCDGVTPLVNRQHPHDLFMELSVVYSHIFRDDASSMFFYIGLPGEPALGPTVFMMRFSGEYNPEAPLGHHWMDSTHITFGVATVGAVLKKNIKFEVSAFNGREPDQHRYDIEKPKFDSGSFRFSWNCNENWSIQASYGYLKSPEQLEPNVHEHRWIASAQYNKAFEQHSNLQVVAILGVKKNKPGRTLPAFLLEGTYEHQQHHLFFSRFETLVNDELFFDPSPLANKKLTINKATFGYIFEWVNKPIKWGIGALLDFPMVGSRLNTAYGSSLASFMLFFQVRII
ncbi:MAG: hypothetical protein AB7R69_00840 [Candidatus Babeliales bacterium]